MALLILFIRIDQKGLKQIVTNDRKKLNIITVKKNCLSVHLDIGLEVYDDGNDDDYDVGEDDDDNYDG